MKFKVAAGLQKLRYKCGRTEAPAVAAEVSPGSAGPPPGLMARKQRINEAAERLRNAESEPVHVAMPPRASHAKLMALRLGEALTPQHERRSLARTAMLNNSKIQNLLEGKPEFLDYFCASDAQLSKLVEMCNHFPMANRLCEPAPENIEGLQNRIDAIVPDPMHGLVVPTPKGGKKALALDRLLQWDEPALPPPRPNAVSVQSGTTAKPFLDQALLDKVRYENGAPYLIAQAQMRSLAARLHAPSNVVIDSDVAGRQRLQNMYEESTRRAELATAKPANALQKIKRKLFSKVSTFK